MKKIFGTFLILLLLSSPGITQQGTGSVSGTVVEYTNGQPVSNADVKLYRVTDSVFVKGTVTDSAGSFALRELPLGR